MKKILIISDGAIGEHFIQRVVETYTSDNIYYVIQSKPREYKNASPSRFKFYQFDPTSLSKLSNLLKMEFVQVIITMPNLSDVENTLKNIRLLKKHLRVIVLNRWDVVNEDANTMYINSNEILASRLLDYLPNVPVIAQNVGIGEGEIMEVLVPFGSSFVYKHIGVIEQKDWRIVAIYRNRKLIMPSIRRMIQPNDLLVLVGNPDVLKSVYRSIKQELGQFPEPFGSNLYLYVDMKLTKNDIVKSLVDKALFAHKKFKHNLIIKVVNPNCVDTLEYIKNKQSEKVWVDIKYDDLDLEISFLEDLNKNHIGLVIISSELFKDDKKRLMFYKAKKPILKISKKYFDTLKDVSLILDENRAFEKISSAIFDVSEQLGFNIEIHNFLNEHQENKEQTIEHYYNLATIFTKTIKVIKDHDNPISVLKKKDNFLQVIPFTKVMLQKSIYSWFSTDTQKHYHRLDEYHQLFIPLDI